MGDFVRMLEIGEWQNLGMHPLFRIPKWHNLGLAPLSRVLTWQKLGISPAVRVPKRQNLVAGVDESASAIALAIENRSLNGISENTCEFQQAEISSFMVAAAQQELQYDLVILDPPKLAPTAKVLAQALRKYRRYTAHPP